MHGHAKLFSHGPKAAHAINSKICVNISHENFYIVTVGVGMGYWRQKSSTKENQDSCECQIVIMICRPTVCISELFLFCFCNRVHYGKKHKL